MSKRLAFVICCPAAALAVGVLADLIAVATPAGWDAWRVGLICACTIGVIAAVLAAFAVSFHYEIVEPEPEPDKKTAEKSLDGLTPPVGR